MEMTRAILKNVWPLFVNQFDSIYAPQIHQHREPLPPHVFQLHQLLRHDRTNASMKLIWDIIAGEQYHTKKQTPEQSNEGEATKEDKTDEEDEEKSVLPRSNAMIVEDAKEKELKEDTKQQLHDQETRQLKQEIEDTVNSADPTHGRSALHWAVVSKDPLHLHTILSACKHMNITPDVTLQDDNGETPLHTALRNGNEQHVKYIIEWFEQLKPDTTTVATTEATIHASSITLDVDCPLAWSSLDREGSAASVLGHQLLHPLKPQKLPRRQPTSTTHLQDWQRTNNLMYAVEQAKRLQPRRIFPPQMIRRQLSSSPDNDSPAAYFSSPTAAAVPTMHVLHFDLGHEMPLSFYHPLSGVYNEEKHGEDRWMSIESQEWTLAEKHIPTITKYQLTFF